MCVPKNAELTSVGSTGLVLGAERALQRFENQNRGSDDVFRRRAMRDLGRQGVLPSESEIAQWQERVIQRELESRRSQRMESAQTAPDGTGAALP